jgi:oligopeptide/dipeptide ABC transporter ATP-binding protein
MSERGKPLVTVEDLEVKFVSREATVHAVNGISFTVAKGVVLGILGESGSGKSVTLRALMRLLPPGKARLTGRVEIAGRNVIALRGRQLSDLRGPIVAMIFQEPMTALDPVFTIGSQLAEVISLHQSTYEEEALRKKVLDVLRLVKIAAPENVIKQYPHELSGGMKQRVMIALALSCNPSLLIADEPTTALDVTIQAQILNLLKDLVRSTGSSMMLITHNLGVVAETCDRICIMYAGRIVEIAATMDLFETPMHPYAKGLLKAFPKLGEHKDELNVIRGTVPNLMKPFAGCPFVDRCDASMDRCRTTSPTMVEARPGHFVSCHLYSGGGVPSDAG